MVLRPDFMLAFVKRYKGELIEVNGDELSDISFDESSETESKSSENTTNEGIIIVNEINKMQSKSYTLQKK